MENMINVVHISNLHTLFALTLCLWKCPKFSLFDFLKLANAGVKKKKKTTTICRELSCPLTLFHCVRLYFVLFTTLETFYYFLLKPLFCMALKMFIP